MKVEILIEICTTTGLWVICAYKMMSSFFTCSCERHADSETIDSKWWDDNHEQIIYISKLEITAIYVT